MSTPAVSLTRLPRSSSPVPIEDVDEGGGSSDYDEEKAKSPMRDTMRKRFGGPMHDIEQIPRSDTMSSLGSVDKVKRKNQRNLQIIKELKKGGRVNVHIAPIFIFLFRDGTVVSIHKDQKLDFTTPIADRLRQRDTGLRTTADPSLLVQSLIDLVVDQALEVIEDYHSKILSLEHKVLIKPTMKSVRRLHILQEDLILHKRTMEPIKTVIYGLRRYDVDRVAALYENLDPAIKVEGFMSHKAKIYLADVHDHMEYILSSLDMFAGSSENLINYTFNMSSYEMNEVMRRLTTATIIFLPLTLLTGYFGMNFTNMWSVHHPGHSDAIFWYIAIPVLLVVMMMFMWSDFVKMWHHMKKRYLERAVKKEVKKNFRKTQ